jgi:hypothetical protein
MVVRALIVCLIALVAGCATFTRDLPEVTEVPVPEPKPRPPIEPAPESRPRPAPEAVPEPPAPVPALGKIAIVMSDRSAAFESVASEISLQHADSLIYNLSDRSLAPPDLFASIEEFDSEVVIAIGLPAAREAIMRSTVPVVFCQVFNIGPTDEASIPVRGVASTPPLALQLDAWRAVNPDLGTIGAILGEGHEDLIAEARSVTAANGIRLELRVARSDRETLFLFQRLAPRIDGFWLFPDNRVLSAAVLQEILAYASRHRVDVAVFNSGFLDLGATLSSTAVYSDIASTALSVAARITYDDADAVPYITPLNEVEIRTAIGSNPAIRPSAGGSSWRSP